MADKGKEGESFLDKAKGRFKEAAGGITGDKGTQQQGQKEQQRGELKEEASEAREEAKQTETEAEQKEKAAKRREG